MTITAEELMNEMKQDKAKKKQCGNLNSRIRETSTTWKILGPIKTTDQAQEEDLHPKKGEGEEAPRNSQTTTQEIHTFTANITEEVIAPKGAQKPRRILLEFSKKGNDEYRLLNAKSTSPKLLATTVCEFSTKSSHNAAISAITTILATFSAVLPSVAGNTVNSAAAANPRNIATTT
jgi:hypothetical protein